MWYNEFLARHSLPPKRILLWYACKCNCIYACQKITAFPALIFAKTHGVISLKNRYQKRSNSLKTGTDNRMFAEPYW
jgi:hypothetical protein